MRFVGSRKRLCIGGWLLGAIVLLSLNAFTLATLQNQPLIAASPEIRALRLKLSLFDTYLAQESQGWQTRFDPQVLLARFMKETPRSPSTAIPDNREVSSAPNPILPQLTGVIKVMDQQGELHFSAVVNGSVYGENEMIREFRITRISDQGVWLTCNGQEWFVAAPEVYYSKDQAP